MGSFDINNIFDFGNELPPSIDARDDINDIMNPEMRSDIPGFEGQDVVVFGNPLDMGNNLDFRQGDNPFEASGNCNLVSTSNFLNLCGFGDANETFITYYAIVNDECVYSEYLSPSDRGGSGTQNMQRILSDFGIDTEVVHPYDSNGDLESIATRLEEGYVGAMGVNAGFLWDDPSAIQDGSVNHEVTLTGTVRDDNGNLIALTVCDSGSGESCHVVPIEQLENCYSNVIGADVVFSAEPLRAI